MAPADNKGTPAGSSARLHAVITTEQTWDPVIATHGTRRQNPATITPPEEPLRHKLTARSSPPRH